VKTGKSKAKVKADEPKLWQKTSYANLVRYNPSGTYFCRIRVRGKLIRKTLKTDVLSVAKLRLTDEEKKHRQAAQRQLALQHGRGQMTFGDAMEIYRARLIANPDIKSKTKDYYEQRIDSLLLTWPGLQKINVRDISKQNCLDWSARYDGSSTAFNNTALVLRAVLDIAIESGVIYENAARHITRRTVRLKELHLPDNTKFIEFVQVADDPLVDREGPATGGEHGGGSGQAGQDSSGDRLAVTKGVGDFLLPDDPKGHRPRRTSRGRRAHEFADVTPCPKPGTRVPTGYADGQHRLDLCRPCRELAEIRTARVRGPQIHTGVEEH
jgi:hypothetical protein